MKQLARRQQLMQQDVQLGWLAQQYIGCLQHIRIAKVLGNHSRHHIQPLCRQLSIVDLVAHHREACGVNGTPKHKQSRIGVNVIAVVQVLGVDTGEIVPPSLERHFSQPRTLRRITQRQIQRKRTTFRMRPSSTTGTTIATTEQSIGDRSANTATNTTNTTTTTTTTGTTTTTNTTWTRTANSTRASVRLAALYRHSRRQHRRRTTTNTTTNTTNTTIDSILTICRRHSRIRKQIGVCRGQVQWHKQRRRCVALC